MTTITTITKITAITLNPLMFDLFWVRQEETNLMTI